MRAFHFTAEAYVPYLLASGLLLTTESNIGSPEGRGTRAMPPVGEHVGPDVVWLTTRDAPEQCGIVSSGMALKAGVRVTVDVADADVSHWPAWAKAQGIHPDWYSVVVGEYDADSWFVVERNIPWTEWIAIDGQEMSGGRNSPCPCGSGRKFKACHLGGREPIWTPTTGLKPTLTEAEIRADKENFEFRAKNGEMVRFHRTGPLAGTEAPPLLPG